VRRLGTGLTATFFAVAVTAAQQPSDQQPSFRSRSDLVRVFVTVIDRDGRLVTTLGQSDFEIRDQGKPQPIVVFDNSPQPIRLIEMLDVSGSMEGNLPLLRDASKALFGQLRPDDVARVGSFGREVTISDEFTHDARALMAALPDEIPPDAPTPLWKALDRAMAAFGHESEDRRAVIVLSDGKDSGATPVPLTRDNFPTPGRHSSSGFERHPVSQGQVIDRARDEDVMIYAIGLRSRRRQQMPPGLGPGGLRAALEDDLPDPGLARVAEETGGGYVEIKPADDLGEAFARVAEELHGQYLLGFAPPQRDGKVHELEVRVANKGLKPRARKSYVASKG
jgi:Ca-activated chloride channel family protein